MSKKEIPLTEGVQFDTLKKGQVVGNSRPVKLTPANSVPPAPPSSVTKKNK
jgi:hypothetical protein